MVRSKNTLQIWYLLIVFPLLLGFQTTPQPQPTLEDFWNGKADWVMDIANVGLPVGESDTLYKGNNEYWSYLHASDQSAGVVDQCGDPVAFPGCTTLWQSTDGGKSFAITAPVCLMQCTSCPCDDQRDHI
ncbi:MAG: hypothetical protein ABI970_10780, partial [Chloroflexota bacterium]